MDSEWDEAKRLPNFRKHGIDFVDAARIFDRPFVETEDLRRDYGERRYRAFGEFDGRVIQVIYTWRRDRRRIITARRARRDERRAYYTGIEQAAREDERQN
jgi:uncharacterized DUF497 family protein